MKFKEFQKQLIKFGYKADYLIFTNYENYISVYRNVKFPTMDGVDMQDQPIVEIADVSPYSEGKFTIKHHLSSNLILLINKFANTNLSKR